MRAVSNTSPLRYLVLIGAIDIVRRLCERVLVPGAVSRERSHANTPAVVRNWAASPPA